MKGRAGLFLAATVFACAQPGTPPGGEPDQTPPLVRDVRPAAFDTVTDLEAPVVIEFDERISERLDGVQDWRDAVLVSPPTSAVEAERHGRRVEISLKDGWEPDRIYRVEVAPVYQDLFSNARERTVYLVFSTGAPFWDGAVAGFVTDRITGRPVESAKLEAERRIDGTMYVAVTDTAGFFALQFLPAGTYDLVAWSDDDRDGLIDFFEIQDSTGLSLGVADTAIAELALLAPDTTPARLARAEALDSITVQLQFDDYFAVGPVDGHARILLLPDSAPGPEAQLVHSARLDSIRAARTDTTAPDTAGVPSPEEIERLTQAAAGRQRGADPPRPAQELVLLLARPLLPDTTYAVHVEGVSNIRGVPGGGGTADFTSPLPPPPPDPATDREDERQDPERLPADTVPGDTVPGDTVPAARAEPADTTLPAPDTVPAPSSGWPSRSGR